jgi:hypothetical protein
VSSIIRKNNHIKAHENAAIAVSFAKGRVDRWASYNVRS